MAPPAAVTLLLSHSVVIASRAMSPVLKAIFGKNGLNRAVECGDAVARDPMMAPKR
ncbi:MAG: hypothetical protein AAFY35_14110 [Pseudomonadota bacterium]